MFFNIINKNIIMLYLLIVLTLINELLSLNIDGIEYNRNIQDNDDILWKDVRELTMGGLAQFSSSVNNIKELPFDRLPLSAKSIVTGKIIFF